MTKHKLTVVRDPEVQPSTHRSTWTATQKLALLAEYAAFPRGSAERGAFLRRNGLYTSHMSKWRDLRDCGAKAGLAARPRGPKPAPEAPLLTENIPLQHELARVQARLTQAEAVIEIKKSGAAAWHAAAPDDPGRAVIVAGVTALALLLGVTDACTTLGVPRSSYYRALQPTPTTPADAGVAEPPPRRRPARSLSEAERTHIRALLNSERFADCAPHTVWATLLDEQQYHCSWRTMYRMLAEDDEVRERRDQLRRTGYTAPELLATAPKQLWSWDITKLRGPATWTYYYLYVILDVFSRAVVGWMIAEREDAAFAEALITETCTKEGIVPQQLTMHADRGSAMTSKAVAQLLADLGVAKSHSRPHVSNDNPYAEAAFKTLKDRPSDPDRFGSLIDARAWARPFFHWYNHIHRHSGIGLLSPATVHAGQASVQVAVRQQVLDLAYLAHPERFVRGRPTPPPAPTAVWINPPSYPREAAPSEVSTALDTSAIAP